MALKDTLEAITTPYLISVSAEAFAAGFLARAGCDVSVQYGANQPEYDLLATKGDRFMKVSVKGSQAGGWGLVQSYKRGRNYHQAIDEWAHHHTKKIVYCFVAFWGVKVQDCPRLYMATVPEVARALKESRSGHGNTTLVESYTPKRGVAKGVHDKIPDDWHFSVARVDKLFDILWQD